MLRNRVPLLPAISGFRPPPVVSKKVKDRPLQLDPSGLCEAPENPNPTLDTLAAPADDARNGEITRNPILRFRSTVTDEEEFAARSQLKWTRESHAWILLYRGRRIGRVVPGQGPPRHVAISQSRQHPKRQHWTMSSIDRRTAVNIVLRDRGVMTLLMLVGLTQTALARDFPLASCKGANGTITELSGIDTEHASMVGIVTAPDAAEYCRRQVPAEPVNSCVRNVLKNEKGIRYRAAVNCVQHVLESKSDLTSATLERYELIRNGEEYFWKTLRSGRSLGNSCADGTPPMYEQFKILCPKEAERLNLP